MSSGDNNNEDELGPFGVSTKHSTMKLIVEDRSIFVNSTFLAERSTYFDALFFGGFEESKKEFIELKEVKADDLVEVLLVLGALPRTEPKEVSEYNCARLLKSSDLWDVAIVRSKCINFLEKRFSRIEATIDNTLDILQVVEEIGIRGLPLYNVTARMAEFKKEDLINKNVHKMMKSPLLSAALFSASGINSHMQLQSHNCTGSSSSECCQYMDCESRVTHKCNSCVMMFCSIHRSRYCHVMHSRSPNLQRNCSTKIVVERDFSSIEPAFFDE